MATSTLAERLEKARTHAGLTQTQLEIATHLGTGFLSRHLAGKRDTMKTEFLERIADACEVDYVWLSTGKGTMRGSGDNDTRQPSAEELPAEDTSPLVRALFRVMDPDKFAEQDFKQENGTGLSIVVRLFVDKLSADN